MDIDYKNNEKVLNILSVLGEFGNAKKAISDLEFSVAARLSRKSKFKRLFTLSCMELLFIGETMHDLKKEMSEITEITLEYNIDKMEFDILLVKVLEKDSYVVNIKDVKKELLSGVNEMKVFAKKKYNNTEEPIKKNITLAINNDNIIQLIALSDYINKIAYRIIFSCGLDVSFKKNRFINTKTIISSRKENYVPDLDLGNINSVHKNELIKVLTENYYLFKEKVLINNSVIKKESISNKVGKLKI